MIYILLFLIYLPNIIMLLHYLYSKHFNNDNYAKGSLLLFIISILIPFGYWIFFFIVLFLMYDEKRKLRKLK